MQWYCFYTIQSKGNVLEAKFWNKYPKIVLWFYTQYWSVLIRMADDQLLWISWLLLSFKCSLRFEDQCLDLGVSNSARIQDFKREGRDANAAMPRQPWKKRGGGGLRQFCSFFLCFFFFFFFFFGGGGHLNYGIGVPSAYQTDHYMVKSEKRGQTPRGGGGGGGRFGPLHPPLSKGLDPEDWF